MTAIPTIQNPLFSWFKRKPEDTAPPPTWADDDLRREYVSRIIASEGCTSEYGAQELMGLFPKDF